MVTLGGDGMLGTVFLCTKIHRCNLLGKAQKKRKSNTPPRGSHCSNSELSKSEATLTRWRKSDYTSPDCQGNWSVLLAIDPGSQAFQGVKRLDLNFYLQRSRWNDGEPHLKPAVTHSLSFGISWKYSTVKERPPPPQCLVCTKLANKSMDIYAASNLHWSPYARKAGSDQSAKLSSILISIENRQMLPGSLHGRHESNSHSRLYVLSDLPLEKYCLCILY